MEGFRNAGFAPPCERVRRVEGTIFHYIASTPASYHCRAYSAADSCLLWSNGKQTREISRGVQLGHYSLTLFPPALSLSLSLVSSAAVRFGLFVSLCRGSNGLKLVLCAMPRPYRKFRQTDRRGLRSVRARVHRSLQIAGFLLSIAPLFFPIFFFPPSPPLAFCSAGGQPGRR